MNENSKSTIVSVTTLLALFFGGGFVGEQLAIALAPHSGVARLLGFLALPFSFILGFFAWAGAAAFVILRWFARVGTRSGPRPTGIPPGAKGFVWSSLLSCSIVGAVTGLLSTEHGFPFAAGAFVALGFAYGALCWRLAQAGWLLFPRE